MAGTIRAPGRRSASKGSLGLRSSFRAPQGFEPQRGCSPSGEREELTSAAREASAHLTRARGALRYVRPSVAWLLYVPFFRALVARVRRPHPASLSAPPWALATIPLPTPGPRHPNSWVTSSARLLIGHPECRFPQPQGGTDERAPSLRTIAQDGTIVAGLEQYLRNVD